MATAYFTTNNAYDSIVIPETRQYLHIETSELADFIAEDTGDFVRDWSGHDMDEGEEAEDYGDVIAYREQGGAVVVLDAERWAERLAFHGLTA